MNKPIGLFDKRGHGYCIYCGEDVAQEDILEYVYDGIDCEICDHQYLSLDHKDNETKDFYTFI